MKVPKYFYNQTGVIPLKKENGVLKICLITSRKKKKWIFPKGIQEPGKTFVQIAEQEAFEEAGLKGKVFPQKVGLLTNKKWKGICTINYLNMDVKEIFKVYPEDFRNRVFVTLKEAKKLLSKKHFELLKKAIKFYSEQQLT